LVKLLQNSAVAYRHQGDYDNAIDLLMQKLDFLGPNINSETLRTFNSLGTIYYTQKKYDQAKEWFNKILDLETDTSASRFRGQALHNLANIHKEEGNYSEAWSAFKQALTEFKSLAQPKDLFLSYKDMADLALIRNQPDLAMSYAQKATLLLGQVPDTPEYFDHYKILARCVQDNDPRQALMYNNLYFEKDKKFDLLQKDLVAQAEGYKIDVALASHEKKLQEQKQKEKLRLSLVYSAIGALILCLIVYVYMDYKKRKLYENNPWFRLFSSATETEYILDDDDKWDNEDNPGDPETGK